MIKPPCKDKNGTDCPNRAVGCQGKCEKYAAFRAELDAANKAERDRNLGALYAADYAWRTFHRTRGKNLSSNQRRLIGQR